MHEERDGVQLGGVQLFQVFFKGGGGHGRVLFLQAGGEGRCLARGVVPSPCGRAKGKSGKGEKGK